MPFQNSNHTNVIGVQQGLQKYNQFYKKATFTTTHFRRVFKETQIYSITRINLQKNTMVGLIYQEESRNCDYLEGNHEEWS